METKLIMGSCDKCFKETDEVFEIGDGDFVCMDCLDDRNNHFELLKDLETERGFD